MVNETETVREKQVNKKKKVRKRKKVKPILPVMVIMMLIIIGLTYSWYLFTDDNQGDRKDVDIMTPYFLYLLNPDDTYSLKFAVGNIHPGETKKIVICVSNKKPVDETEGSIDIARESKFNYDLEFIHTENLPVNYDIYELQKYDLPENATVDDNWILVDGISNYYWIKMQGQLNENGTAKPLEVTKDLTGERLQNVFGTETPEGVINKGKYLLYKYDGQAEPQPMGLEYRDGKYEFDYYLVEISWKEGIVFNDYTKETDLVYVVVNAKQPEPREQTAENP